MHPENTNLLTINGGSSSIKFAMYKMAENPVPELYGSITRIGSTNEVFTVTSTKGNKKKKLDIYAPGFYQAAVFMLDWLAEQPGFDQVGCIGHRIVHGLDHAKPEIIDSALLKELKQIRAYDPDHLPAEIEIIELFKMRYPSLLQVACFDTSFHSTMPRMARLLAIPRRFDRAGIRRYGFHGLSYDYLMEKLRNMVGTDAANGKVVLAHLGNGASITAVKEGRSIDTSMGFTPTGGLMMGTRSGDLDPGVARYIMEKEQMGEKQFNYLINHEAGLLGVSEISADVRDLLLKEDSDIRAAEAVALFCYQAKKWIGAFTTVLGGLDILVFSGGIGENAPIIRSRICRGLGFLGIILDEDKNNKNSSQISTAGSKVMVKVIPTNEELTIAKKTTGIYLKSTNNKKQFRHAKE